MPHGRIALISNPGAETVMSHEKQANTMTGDVLASSVACRYAIGHVQYMLHWLSWIMGYSDYLCHDHVTEWYKRKYIFMFPTKQQNK